MRIAAPSWVIPATRLDNVKYLQGKVDEVELLYMASTTEYDTPEDEEVQAIADIGMRYNIHMPYDRDFTKFTEWEFIAEFAERLKQINAATHTFHICPDESFFEGVEWFVKKTSMPVTLENGGADYELFDMMGGIDAKICLDVGHMVKYEQNVDYVLNKHSDRIEMFHLHGVKDGKDHTSIRYLPDDIWKTVFGFARERNLTVSLEVFSEADLNDCLLFLDNCSG